jgi:hypothetical protein
MGFGIRYGSYGLGSRTISLITHAHLFIQPGDSGLSWLVDSAESAGKGTSTPPMPLATSPTPVPSTTSPQHRHTRHRRLSVAADRVLTLQTQYCCLSRVRSIDRHTAIRFRNLLIRLSPGFTRTQDSHTIPCAPANRIERKIHGSGILLSPGGQIRRYGKGGGGCAGLSPGGRHWKIAPAAPREGEDEGRRRGSGVCRSLSPGGCHCRIALPPHAKTKVGEGDRGCVWPLSSSPGGRRCRIARAAAREEESTRRGLAPAFLDH